MEKENKKVMIEGVGKDAEIEVLPSGGRHSKSPMAMHLVDPIYIMLEFNNNIDSKGLDCAFFNITQFMAGDGIKALLRAMSVIEPDKYKRVIRIAKVLQEGADKYEPNNWRLIPQEAHLNHALIHLLAAVMGDTQDNHLDHALTRLMMAISTKVSPGFDYTRYIKKAE